MLPFLPNTLEKESQNVRAFAPRRFQEASASTQFQDLKIFPEQSKLQDQTPFTPSKFQDCSLAFVPTRFRMWLPGEEDEEDETSSHGSRSSPASWSPTPPTAPRRNSTRGGGSPQTTLPPTRRRFSDPAPLLQSGDKKPAADRREAVLSACPIITGCFCHKDDMARHLIQDHSLQSTTLGTDKSFRTTITFSVSGETKRSGVVLEIDGGHFLWLLDRHGDAKRGIQDLGISVYALGDEGPGGMNLTIACSKYDDFHVKKVWTGQVRRLEHVVRPRVVRLRYPDNDLFKRMSEDMVAVIIETTIG